MKNKPTLYFLVGLPGSSKSTWAANKQKENPNIVIHSSDALREELLGDINNQDKNPDIFLELHRRIKRDLIEGKDVIEDCTNLSRKFRMAFLRELKKIECHKVCVFFAVPFEICMERNKNRDRVVPAEVMWRMYKSFNVPCKNEGFDDVAVLYGDNGCWYGYYGDAMDKIISLKHISHDNHHHKLSIGDHCLKAYNTICETFNVDYIVKFATLLHDVGKVKTKVWENAKGEPTMESHYYGHESVSAYDSLFYDWRGHLMLTPEHLRAALLIELHIKFYGVYEESEKSVRVDQMLLGDNGWMELNMLHSCDQLAH